MDPIYTRAEDIVRDFIIDGGQERALPHENHRLAEDEIALNIGTFKRIPLELFIYGLNKPTVAVFHGWGATGFVEWLRTNWLNYVGRVATESLHADRINLIAAAVIEALQPGQPRLKIVLTEGGISVDTVTQSDL